MRTASQHAPCAAGAFSHPGYLFERQRAAMRQNAFARARSCASAASKRKARDGDGDGDASSSDDNSAIEQLPHAAHKRRRVVLDGFKRLRVSSPPSSTSTSYNNVTSDCAMADDDENAATARNRAIVRVGNEWEARQQQPVPTKWTPTASWRYTDGAPNLQMPPADPSCTAIVLFNAPTTTAIPRSLNPNPRVQLVESDEEETSSSDDEQPFVRFEEIVDEEEPMEID